MVPLLYLLFDDLNPALAKRCPAVSEALDNVVVFVLPGDFGRRGWGGGGVSVSLLLQHLIVSLLCYSLPILNWKNYKN